MIGSKGENRRKREEENERGREGCTPRKLKNVDNSTAGHVYDIT